MRAQAAPSTLATGQRELVPLPLTGIRPDMPQGQHIEFVGEVGADVYYCKADRFGIAVCATEWFYTHLAAHLGIAVPDCAKIYNPENGEVLFGSKETFGTADRFEAQTLLLTPPARDPAIGDPYPWLGSYLSRLFAFDLLIGNPDRQLVNYLLVNEGRARRLLAYDFASSRLEFSSAANFDVADTQTMFVGRRLRKLRAFDPESAFELLDRVKAVPLSEVESILSSVPQEWISDELRERVHEQWQKGVVRGRVEALRAGLKNGSLL